MTNNFASNKPFWKNTYAKVFILVLIVLAAISVASLVSDDESDESATPTPTQNTTTQTQNRTNTTTTTTTTNKGTTSGPSYEQLVAQYDKAGTRIQFDIACQAKPNQITVVRGTSIMLDNRSGDARWISVGSTGYNIPGLSYRIFPINSTASINCGSAVNVGQIIVQ